MRDAVSVHFCLEKTDFNEKLRTKRTPCKVFAVKQALQILISALFREGRIKVVNTLFKVFCHLFGLCRTAF